MFSRIAAFYYGVACYLVFFASFLCAIWFIGNVVVPISIDSGPQEPLIRALAIDFALLGLLLCSTASWHGYGSNPRGLESCPCH